MCAAVSGSRACASGWLLLLALALLALVLALLVVVPVGAAAGVVPLLAPPAPSVVSGSRIMRNDGPYCSPAACSERYRAVALRGLLPPRARRQSADRVLLRGMLAALGLLLPLVLLLLVGGCGAAAHPSTVV